MPSRDLTTRAPERDEDGTSSTLGDAKARKLVESALRRYDPFSFIDLGRSHFEQPYLKSSRHHMRTHAESGDKEHPALKQSASFTDPISAQRTDGPFVPSAHLLHLANSPAIPKQKPPLDASHYVTPRVPCKPTPEEEPLPPDTEEETATIEINTLPGEKLRILRGSADHRMSVRISKLLDAEASRPDDEVLILKHLMAELKGFYASDYRKEARRTTEKHRIVARMAEIRERLLEARYTQVNAGLFDPSPRGNVGEVIDMADWETYEPISFYDR